MSRWADAAAVLRGAQMVASATVKQQLRTAELRWQAGSIKPCVEQANTQIRATLDAKQLPIRAQEGFERASMVYEGFRQGGLLLAAKISELRSEASSHRRQRESETELHEDFPSETVADDVIAESTIVHPVQVRTKPMLNAADAMNLKGDQKLSEESRERRVPASRIGRLMQFGQLGIGLGAGAVTETMGRALGFRKNPTASTSSALLENNPFLSEANADRIVKTLCRVRGAALKLGQMLSLQDESLVPKQLHQIFERVRQSADFMPIRQVNEVMESELGADWRSNFEAFEEKPFAAASIGQVHKGVLKDGREVALKIQYPGVASSINSDIDNLITLLNVGSLLPAGAYMETFLKTARQELALECDYRREAEASKRFAQFLADDPDFFVPTIVDTLTTRQVLTTDLIYGIQLDKCASIGDAAVRDWIGEKIIGLCLRELFEFRYMQSDPNWANFFYNAEKGQIILLDFGATREYSKEFVDRYLQIIKAARDQDREGILKYSKEIGFLTGYETKEMQDAHCSAVLILGEAFASRTPFDFGQQSATAKVNKLIPVMLKHRLTPPPPETYSIHRKLAGAFLLCTKLQSRVHCRPLFDKIYANYMSTR